MESCACSFHRSGGAPEFACDSPQRPRHGSDMLLEVIAQRRGIAVPPDRPRTCCPFHGSGGTWAAPCDRAALLSNLRFRRRAFWIIQGAGGRDLAAVRLSSAPTAAAALALIRERYPAFAADFESAIEDVPMEEVRAEMVSLARQLMIGVDPRAALPYGPAVLILSAEDEEKLLAPAPPKDDGSRARMEELVRRAGPLVDLWLDDVREPSRFGAVGFLWARTAAQAIAVLATGVVRFASLDHDLDTAATIGLPAREPTGYDVVAWMEQTDCWPPDGVRVHSMNPSGAQRMLQVIRKHYGRTF